MTLPQSESIEIKAFFRKTLSGKGKIVGIVISGMEHLEIGECDTVLLAGKFKIIAGAKRESKEARGVSDSGLFSLL